MNGSGSRSSSSSLVDRLAALLVVAGMHGAAELLALALRLGHARVVAVDVAHAELRHLLVALLHLAHRPLERDHRLLRIGDHGREQMRDAVIDRELEHFRIDHDQPALLGPQPVEQAQDHGVDGDRLAGAGGAGDQQMRHAREIDDHRLAADGLAEAERQLGGGVDVVAAGELLAQKDLLARRVRQLDADGIASGHHGDARRERAHGAGDVVGEPDHARGLDARRRLELVERDHRSRPRIDDLAAHAEVAEHAFERGGVGLQRVGAQHARGRCSSARRGARAGAAHSRRSTCALARCAAFGLRGARRGLLVFILVVVLRVEVRLQRGAGAFVEARLGAGIRRRRGRATRRGAGARRVSSRDETRLEAEEAVRDPAERDRRVLLVARRPASSRIAGIGMPSETGSDREADQRCGAGRDGDRDARQSGERAAGKQSRQPQHPIADHAAEPGRQRPGRAPRQAGGACRRQAARREARTAGGCARA